MRLLLLITIRTRILFSIITGSITIIGTIFSYLCTFSRCINRILYSIDCNCSILLDIAVICNVIGRLITARSNLIGSFVVTGSFVSDLTILLPDFFNVTLFPSLSNTFIYPPTVTFVLICTFPFFTNTDPFQPFS